jgi:hypothetical protein
MHVRSQLPAVALPLAARSTLRIDYLKMAVWLLGGLVPWAGITALYLGH